MTIQELHRVVERLLEADVALLNRAMELICPPESTWGDHEFARLMGRREEAAMLVREAIICTREAKAPAEEVQP